MSLSQARRAAAQMLSESLTGEGRAVRLAQVIEGISGAQVALLEIKREPTAGTDDSQGKQ